MLIDEPFNANLPAGWNATWQGSGRDVPPPHAALDMEAASCAAPTTPSAPPYAPPS